MKKRVLSLILAFVMLISILPAPALAADDDPLQTGKLTMLAEFSDPDKGPWLESVTAHNLPSFAHYDTYFTYTDSTGTRNLSPEELTMPSMLTVDDYFDDGHFVLQTDRPGTGYVTYTDPSDGVVHGVKITVDYPDIGLYSDLPIGADTIMDAVVITETTNTFYIALSPELAEDYVFAQINTTFGPEVRNESITSIGTVELAADGNYAKVTVSDLYTRGSYHFEAQIADKNGNHAGSWGRTVWVENDMPCFYVCDIRYRDDECAPDYENPTDSCSCAPGNTISGVFYFDTLSRIRAGKATPLSADVIDFPEYLLVRPLERHGIEIPDGALELEPTRFANATENTDILYTVDGKTYKIHCDTEMMIINFSTQPTVSESTVIHPHNPFELTETNRTFYLGVSDPDLLRLTAADGWMEPEPEACFTVNASADETYLIFTMKDDAVLASGNYYYKVTFEWNDQGIWREEETEVRFSLKNNHPMLMYRELFWDEQNECWYESEKASLRNHLELQKGNSRPVVFYYGTEESKEKIDVTDLILPEGLVSFYKADGHTFIKGLGFDESGVITYADADKNIHASLTVTVQHPEIALYTVPAISKDAHLGEEVPVSVGSFYVVANDELSVLAVEHIRWNDTDVTDRFDIAIDQNNRCAKITPKKDKDGTPLAAGGRYHIEIRHQWGPYGISFELIRDDLQQLPTPTPMSWHKQYHHGATSINDYEIRMGAVSFEAIDSQNRFHVKIYSAEDNYTNPVSESGWSFGDTKEMRYFSVTDFIYAELPSGTYKYSVRAEGDGTKYRNSAWSELSEAFVYTAPTAVLPAPDAETFDWIKEWGHYQGTWRPVDDAGVGYYEVNWYYLDTDTNERRQSGGNFDIHADYVSSDGLFYTAIPDEELEKHGNVPYYFRVRAIPADITTHRVSPWSDWSPALDMDNVTESVNSRLDDLIQSETPPSVQEVQDALSADTAELRAAMAADGALSGGENSGTLDRIRELEQTVADHVTTDVDVKNNSVPQNIKDIADDIEMVGAGLNFADNHPGDNGKDPVVTLEISVPKKNEEIVIPTQMHNTVQFSMKLNGAVNYPEDADDNMTGQQLAVPIVIDMPVPAGINPNFLVILHRRVDGSVEQMRPYIYTADDGRARATFVIDSFSVFAFAEYRFAFEQDSLAKMVGDLPFTVLPTGYPAGGTVTYSSDNPAVASVHPETGEVTVHKAGIAVITASVAAGYGYPAAQASYVLTVSDQVSNPGFTASDAVSYYPVVVAPTVKGNAYADTALAMTGTPVTITAEPDLGYTVGAIAAVSQNGTQAPVFDNGNGTYTFIQPSGEVTVYVSFIRSSFTGAARRYADVDPTAWYYDAADYVLSNGLMNGIGNDLFAPNDTTTRAMIVTILWRMEGKPAAPVNSFKDIARGQWYTEAIDWAASSGIVNGYGDIFDPMGEITREQFMTILWRYAQYKGYPVGASDNSLTGMDASSVSAYAVSAMQWALNTGVMHSEEGKLLPKTVATRAYAASFFYEFIRNVE